MSGRQKDRLKYVLRRFIPLSDDELKEITEYVERGGELSEAMKKILGRAS